MTKPEFHELVDTWWKTAEIFDAMPGCEKIRTDWHASVFKRILAQVGWSTEEWNNAVEQQKHKA